MIHFLFLLINVLIMMALPFVIGHFAGKRMRLDWGLFGIGAGTFVLSQVGHIPFNQFIFERVPALQSNLLLLALFAGLSAAIFEEGARHLMYRYWAREARDWAGGIMLGIGHGGIESFLTGLLAAINGYALFMVRDGGTTPLVPAAQLPMLQQAVATILHSPPYALLLGAAERLFAITLHIALSLVVLQGFRRNQVRWLFYAIGLHAFFDATAVYAAATWNVYLAELCIGLIAGLMLFFVWRLRPAQSPEAAAELLSEIQSPARLSVELSAEKLDDSRFQ